MPHSSNHKYYRSPLCHIDHICPIHHVCPVNHMCPILYMCPIHKCVLYNPCVPFCIHVDFWSYWTWRSNYVHFVKKYLGDTYNYSAVIKQNPSTAWNHHSSFFIHPSSIFIHPSSFFIYSEVKKEIFKAINWQNIFIEFLIHKT